MGRHVVPLRHIILIPNKPVLALFSFNFLCSRTDISIAHLALNNNHPLTPKEDHVLIVFCIILVQCISYDFHTCVSDDVHGV